MKYYTIGNGKSTEMVVDEKNNLTEKINPEYKIMKIAVPTGKHMQYIWNTSEIYVSKKTYNKIQKKLGSHEYYTNPLGHFGRAERVEIKIK